MRETQWKRPRRLQAIVTATIGLAFLLQLTVLSLHLAENHHLIGPGKAAHEGGGAQLADGDGGHGHGAHQHAGATPRPSGHAPDHAPHPIEDHLDELFEIADTTSEVHAPCAILPREVSDPDAPPLVARRAQVPQVAPRPPPPRSSPPSRAPPIVS